MSFGTNVYGRPCDRILPRIFSNLLKRYESHLPPRERKPYLFVLALMLCFWPLSGNCAPSKTVAHQQPLSANHYLIPGFSDHLIAYGRLVYEDLEEARNAANAHRTLALRLALADASGHLLQLSTPPRLAALRDQMVTVRQALEGRNGSSPEAAWSTLINMIKHLPLRRADQDARTRLLLTAEQGQNLTQNGDIEAASKQLQKLISEIEITSHVFPISAVRKSVGAAVTAASALSPRWSAAAHSIAQALLQTRWIIRPLAEHDIHAFDDLVAAYVQWPEDPTQAKASLQYALRWLSLDYTNHALMLAVRKAVRSPSLNLHVIGHLQTQLAATIRQSHQTPPGTG